MPPLRGGPENDVTLEELTACPACEAAERRILYSDLDALIFPVPGRWRMDACASCGSAYLNPRPTAETIAEAYPTSYYTHAPPDPEAKPSSTWRRIRRAARNGYLELEYGYELHPSARLAGRVVSLVPPARRALDRLVHHLSRPSPGARLLDVGCGNGTLLLRMGALGWVGIGVDPDAAAVALARAARLDVRLGRVAESAFADGAFDAVTLDHTLEHFHNPVAELEECRRVLRPGGTVWIATPNLSGRAHRREGAAWLGLDPPRHLVLFTPASLRALLARIGLGVTQLTEDADEIVAVARKP
jgi:2-polyprenyl-3-methyl-5-hydroxy-6-metoxy-1,4-benzoquinol methylase